MSLTGGLAGGGKQSLLGFEIWRDEINAKGGLLGRPVQLVHFDDQSNPANVPGLYAKLIDVDKVDLVVSAYATNQITPAMPVVMQKNMVYMGLFGTDVNAKFNYDRYFATIPNGPDGKRAPTLGFLEVAAGMNPKPQTIALVAADAEYAQTVIAGARETVAKLGFKTVYDRSYPPNTVDYSPIVRAVNAANPDIICIASYPPDSVGLIRASNEIGIKPRIFGGAMIGLGFTPIKAQLGPLLNGIVNYDTYVPEPTMKFPGVDAFLKTYQERAPAAGVDLHGFFLPPFRVCADAGAGAGRNHGWRDRSRQDRGRAAQGHVQHHRRRDQVRPGRRMAEEPDADHPVPGHPAWQCRPVQAGRQAGDPASERVEVGDPDRAVYEGARLEFFPTATFLTCHSANPHPHLKRSHRGCFLLIADAMNSTG